MSSKRTSAYCNHIKLSNDVDFFSHHGLFINAVCNFQLCGQKAPHSQANEADKIAIQKVDCFSINQSYIAKF